MDSNSLMTLTIGFIVVAALALVVGWAMWENSKANAAGDRHQPTTRSPYRPTDTATPTSGTGPIRTNGGTYRVIPTAAQPMTQPMAPVYTEQMYAPIQTIPAPQSFAPAPQPVAPAPAPAPAPQAPAPTAQAPAPAAQMPAAAPAQPAQPAPAPAAQAPAAQAPAQPAPAADVATEYVPVPEFIPVAEMVPDPARARAATSAPPSFAPAAPSFAPAAPSFAPAAPAVRQAPARSTGPVGAPPMPGYTPQYTSTPRAPQTTVFRLGRILWVDDNPDSHVPDVVALHRMGLTVTVATHCEAALAYLGAEKYMLVITDCVRDGDTMSTAEFVRTVRRNYPGIPTVAYDPGAVVTGPNAPELPHDEIVTSPGSLPSVVGRLLGR